MALVIGGNRCTKLLSLRSTGCDNEGWYYIKPTRLSYLTALLIAQYIHIRYLLIKEPISFLFSFFSSVLVSWSISHFVCFLFPDPDLVNSSRLPVSLFPLGLLRRPSPVRKGVALRSTEVCVL